MKKVFYIGIMLWCAVHASHYIPQHVWSSPHSLLTFNSHVKTLSHQYNNQCSLGASSSPGTCTEELKISQTFAAQVVVCILSSLSTECTVYDFVKEVL